MKRRVLTVNSSISRLDDSVDGNSIDQERRERRVLGIEEKVELVFILSVLELVEVSSL